jgi:hypothetical protein
MTGRRIISLPDVFAPVKQTFKKIENRFWFEREQNLSNKAYYLLVLYSLQKAVEHFINSAEQSGLDSMTETNTFKVMFSEYGKKIEYLPESTWFEETNMTESDFIEQDKVDNMKFLKKSFDN